MEMKISEILSKYETDKVCGTPKGGDGHCYGAYYDSLFASYDKESVLDILEIGTQKGGSLAAWKDYFNNATVTGVDIVDVVKEEYKRNDIKYYVTDIKYFNTDEIYDIIIDDGSHHIDDVLFVVRNFCSKLKKGGTMVIEDVQAPRDWLISILDVVSSDYEVTYEDMTGVHGNYDDFLIIIKRLWK